MKCIQSAVALMHSLTYIMAVKRIIFDSVLLFRFAHSDQATPAK